MSFSQIHFLNSFKFLTGFQDLAFQIYLWSDQGVRVCVCEGRHLRRTEEGTEFSGGGVISSCESPGVVLVAKPEQEPQALLTF